MKLKLYVLFAFLSVETIALNGQSFQPPSFTLFDAAQAAAAQAVNSREEELYKDGSQSLNEAKWGLAAAKFNQVVGLRGHRADAALYWRAYSLNKLGRRPEALSSIAELRKDFPRSDWLKDANALEVEIRQSSGQPANPDIQADEDLKLLALNSLMNSDEERAVPMLQKFLQSNNSPKLKERALFILAQSDSAQARQALAAVARGETHPELQLKAIHFLGLDDSKENQQALTGIYAASSNLEVKRAILQAFLTSDSAENLLAVARQERDPQLRLEAVHTLGAMDARDQLHQLYQSSHSVEEKGEILKALAIAEDVNTLADIARSPGDAQLRVAAIHGLGIAGDEQARQALVQVYLGDKDRDIKRAAMEGLFIQDDAHDLIELTRKETDPEMRRALVEKLSIMDSKESKEFMMELLNR